MAKRLIARISMDAIGRIVIPKTARIMAGFDGEPTELDIYFDPATERIILEKAPISEKVDEDTLCHANP